METEQWILAVINIAGGVAVLGSYAHGILKHPATRGQAWGAVPARIKPLYMISMLFAAAGYLAFAYFALFKMDPDEVETMGGTAFPVFYAACLIILITSALWMPFTFAMLERPDKVKWYVIRVVLAIVGLASLLLLASLITLEPREPAISYWAATVGIGFFCVQTALLDALVWPAYFSVDR